jgi:hypothetical protein
MFNRKRDKKLNDELDSLGKEIIRISKASNEEIEASISSPFLYARLRARISSEQERLELKDSWSIFLIVAKRAIPAMALVTVFAFGVFWFDSIENLNSSITRSGEEATIEVSQEDMDYVVFTREENSISNDEIIETIVYKAEDEEFK